MKINRFDKINAQYIEEIDGQSRYYYYSPQFPFDFFDFIEDKVLKNAKSVDGTDLYFLDTKTGKTYQPFAPEKNVLISNNITFFNGKIYFIVVDFNIDLLTVYKYLPGEKPEVVVIRTLHDTKLYNIQLIPGDDQVYLIAEDYDPAEDDNADEENEDDEEDQEEEETSTLNICYFPEQLTIEEGPDETLLLIHNHQLYFDHDVEIYDDDGNYVSGYDEVVVKDFDGNVVHREKGALQLLNDGNWWIG